MLALACLVAAFFLTFLMMWVSPLSFGAVHLLAPLPLLDDLFQFGEPLEGDRAGEFHSLVVQQVDDVVVEDLRTLDVLANGSSVDGEAVQVEVIAEPVHQSPQPAGIVIVLHQVGFSDRPDIRDDGYPLALFVEVFQVERLDGGIGRTLDGGRWTKTGTISCAWPGFLTWMEA